MARKGNFVSFFVFIFLIFKLINGNLSFDGNAELVKSIAENFSCKFVLILSNSSDGFSREVRLEKQINDAHQLYVGVWDFKALIRNFYSDEVSTHRTLVVMEYSILNLENLRWISNRMSLASYDWLIISSFSSNIDYFKSIIIPLNCRFIVSTMMKNDTITLHEIYKVSRNSELIIKAFGLWKVEYGLKALEGDVFNRRMNLRGHQFNFAVHNLSCSHKWTGTNMILFTVGLNPCEAVHIDNGKQMIQCAYFEVWKDLGRLLNYTTNYMVIEDCYQNGSRGLSTPTLDMIRTGEADSGEDGYIWSSSRLIDNQFFWPLFHSKVILVTKIPPRKFSFSSYVRPFTTSMWLALISWLLISGIVIIVMRMVTARYFFRQKILINNNTVENLFLPFRAICYQGSPAIPENLTLRFLHFMVYLIPVLLIPSYSGSIISFLSVPFENIPFLDLDEFEKDGTYQLNAINNTFFQVFLMTDDQFESLRRKKLISTAMTVSFEQSFQEICSKSVTYMFEWPLLTKYSINCKVFKFDLPLKKIFSSMAVRKNFPYLELFNRQMEKIISSGLNMKILEKNALNLFKHLVNPFPQHYFQIKPFGLQDVLPLFAVLAVGILVSLFILFVENEINGNKKIKIRNM